MDSGLLENFPIRTKVYGLSVVRGNPQKPLLCRIGLAAGEEFEPRPPCRHFVRFWRSPLSHGLSAETCPKVSYTNPTSTIKDLVAVVNCLAASSEQASAAKIPSKVMQAESIQIVGPQHSRPYPNLVMVLLRVPTSGVLKSAVVTPETKKANVTAEAGGSCSVKINPDKAIDSRCYIAGGTVYILYR